MNNTLQTLQKKRKSKKGFTLMEMLIVVAIIAILVAIAIPTFSSQLNEAKKATDKANIRSAYAVMQTSILTGKSPTGNGNLDTAATYVMQQDGSFRATTATDGKPYQLKSAIAANDVETVPSFTGVVGNKIVIKYNSTSSIWVTDSAS